MADFNHDFIGWLIGLISLVSIFGIVYLAWNLSRKKSGDEGGKVKSTGHIWDETLQENNNPLPRWWLNLLFICCIWGLGYLVMYPGLGAYPGLLNWSQESQYDEEVGEANTKYGPIFDEFLSKKLSDVATDPKAHEIGQRLFATYCTVCHGSDARGARGFPNLTDDDWLYGGELETIKATIMGGRIGGMPAWEAIIGREAVFNVGAYVRQLSGQDVDEQVAFKGKEVFETNCVACHGADAKGNQQIGAPNLTDDIWLYGGSQKRILESISKGRTGLMPAHKEFLGEAKAHILAAYVYSLSQGKDK